jgi:hypothetical protein
MASPSRSNQGPLHGEHLRSTTPVVVTLASQNKTVSPNHQRAAADHLGDLDGISQRLICNVPGVWLDRVNRRRHRADEPALNPEIK